MSTQQATDRIHFPTDAEVDAEIRKTLRTQTEARITAPSFDDVLAAIQQLRRSERGNACLKRFGTMLNAYGFGLDTTNWQALATLHRAGQAGNQCMIRDLMEAVK
jgi:hypothetical protein